MTSLKRALPCPIPKDYNGANRVNPMLGSIVDQLYRQILSLQDEDVELTDLK